MVTLAGELWYDRPAGRWFEALPIGNGRLGGMAYGGVPTERIDLSESTAWSGGPSTVDLGPTAREQLPNVRKLLFAGEHAQAQQLAAEHLLGTRASFGTNLPLPHLRLTFDHTGVAAYRRALDLDQGLVSVTYGVNGVQFTREVLASHPHGVIAVRLTANRPGALSFTAGLAGSVFPGRTTTTHSGIAFSGRAVESLHSDGTTGALVEIRVHVEAAGGTTWCADDVYEVVGADSAVLIVAVGTDWDGDDPVRRVDNLLAAAVDAGYDAVRTAHVADHSRLMRRVSLDLGAGLDDVPTDRRREHPDDGLIALYFQYGRYLTVAGSRADSPLPLALQGLWNDGLASSASWSNDFHLDMNTQQNYWATEPTNLAECHTPLFRLLEQLAETGQSTATQMYDAPGWVAHTVTNAWGYSAPGTAMGWGLNVTGGAWLATHLWEHYEYGGDQQFLRETAYPILRDAARFLLAYLTEDPATGHLVAGPSESPENWYVAPGGSHCSVAMGNTVDRVFAAAILRDCAAGAEILDVDPDLRRRIAPALGRLSPYRIGRNGQLQEWLHDFEEADPAHRHTSHLCALFPEREITPRTTPELARAAEVTIERRQTAAGWEQTEWVEANFALFHARLLQGDKALAHLTSLITDASEANLLSYSVGGVAGAAQNIYSFDGNAGGTAAVAEMLLQSDLTELELLPALPTTWLEGSVQGLRARSGFTVDLTWTNGRLDHATIHPPRATTHRIRYADHVTEIDFADGTPVTVRANHRNPAMFEDSWTARLAMDCGERRSWVSTEQRSTLDAILRQAPFPADLGVTELREQLRALLSAQPLPPDVTVTAGELGGVPTAEITVAGVEPRRTVLYFHGGVYVLGEAALSADLASQIARRIEANAISVEYRLGPEHPFPAAVDDALAAYQGLLDNGIAPADIVLAGESAGGGLAVAMMVRARDQGLPLPVAAYLMSPYADLTLAGASMTTKREADPLMNPDALLARIADYAAGQDPALGLISPIFADLTGLPPLIIQAGSHEVLLDDATRLAREAAAADVEVTLAITPGVPHVFQAYHAILDEGTAALDQAGRLLSGHIADAVRVTTLGETGA